MRFLMAVACLLVLPACQTPHATADPAASARPEERPKVEGPGTRVEIAVIQPSHMALSLSLPGEVEASRDAQLAASLGGYVEKVNVKAGDVVKKGEVLALVDTASHTSRRAQAGVELKTAKRELERAEKLGGAIPGAQLDAAKSRLEAAEAAYRSADVQVARSIISAPFAGKVAAVDIEVGEVAAPGLPLIRVVQVDPIKVSVSLSDRDVSMVRVGMPAKVTPDARATMLDGKVAHVTPAADINTRTFIAEVEVENGEQLLLPGMIATVHIAPEAGEQGARQIVVSQDWLVTKPAKLGVFVHQDGVAKWRDVRVGSVVRDSVVVLEGLGRNDELVIRGHRELADGDKLIIARRGTCCRDGRAFFESDGNQ